MRISDWSSDVCSSDLHEREGRTGTEGDDFRAAAEDALGCNTAEADPLLEAPFDPGQFDLREAAVRRTDRRRITTNRRSINRIAAHQRCTGRAGRVGPRSEERRVGKEWGRRGRSRW